MILEVNSINAGYLKSNILFDISLKIEDGSCVSILGRNGMGKTTLIKSIMGIIPIKTGVIKFNRNKISGMPSHEISRLGIGLVPEGRHIFSNLTVKENLQTFYKTSHFISKKQWDLEKVLDLFPKLSEKLKNFGNQLSGGEQQMLAIGRALMTNPKLLILDEATEGLAPIIREEIWECLKLLKSEKLSILLIDKNINSISKLTDNNYIIEKGRNVWEGSGQNLLNNRNISKKFLSF